MKYFRNDLSKRQNAMYNAHVEPIRHDRIDVELKLPLEIHTVVWIMRSILKTFPFYNVKSALLMQKNIIQIRIKNAALQAKNI